MSALPLLGHAGLDEVFAYRPAGTVTVRAFLADVRALRVRLPSARHVLNLCQDRYCFSVGLAAGLLAGCTSLQPASQSATTLQQIRRDCPDVFCFHDQRFDIGDLPGIDVTGVASEDLAAVDAIPAIRADLLAVVAYTSGSTGLPVPHGKSWGSLVRNARAEASRLGLFGETRHVIVGTVPAQHMYGFESTVLLALHGNAPFWSGKPFYPQDIAAALAAVPAPRLLVTTPFHLATLLASGVDLPAVDRLLSATAPLSSELASEAEQRLAAPLDEIYGCTESGQLASRRLVADPAWLPLDGVRLERDGDLIVASGGHVEGRVALGDQIELLPDGRFLLLGRSADLISIAGKRSSLAYLNHQLLAIPEVIDGTFFLPDEGLPTGITRLCAFAVAPGIDTRRLLARLRARIDTVFLPRPLFLVDQLPRNSTGKLPRADLLALYAACRKKRHAPG